MNQFCDLHNYMPCGATRIRSRNVLQAFVALVAVHKTAPPTVVRLALHTIATDTEHPPQ